MPTTLAPSRPINWLVLGHHDADGIISAAIAGAFLRDQDPSRRFEFGTVDFHLQPVWRDAWSRLSSGTIPWRESEGFPTPDGLALVDFPWMPVPRDLPLFYADHHATAFAPGQADSEQFGARRAAGEPVMHARHGSCAIMMLDTLRDRFGWQPPESLLEAARIAHQVDTAGYDSPDAALDFRAGTPAAIDLLTCALSEREAAGVSRALSLGASIDDALFAPYAARFAEVRVQAEEAIAVVNTSSELLDGTVVVVDGTRDPLSRLAVPKFAEYGIGGALHAIKTREIQSQTGEPTISVTLGRSPWAPASDGSWAYPDLGQIASRIGGGGGHPYAAGFRVSGPTLEMARRKVRALVTLIAPHLRRLAPTEEFADSTSLTPDQKPFAPAVGAATPSKKTSLR